MVSKRMIDYAQAWKNGYRGNIEDLGKGGGDYSSSSKKQKKSMENTEKRLASGDTDFIKSEIDRAKNVINQRSSSGVSTSNQENYLERLQGMQPNQTVTTTNQNTNSNSNAWKSKYEELADQISGMQGKSDDWVDKYNSLQDQFASSEERWKSNYTDLQSTLDGFKEEYNNWKDFDTNQYKTETATIEDIAQKYGFNYSRDYAKTQAEAERQAKQDGLNEAKQQVENNVVSSADGLDRDYFNQYMQQQQAQANSGLNGGIAADQNLRMSMNRQAEMGDIYRDANANQFQIDNELARLASEALAREDQIYNDRRQQGFENVLADASFRQSDNLARLQSELRARGQEMDLSKFQTNFARMLERDSMGDRQNDRNFDFNQEQFDWSKVMDQVSADQSQQRIDNQMAQYLNSFNNIDAGSLAQLSGQLPNGNPTMAREQMDFRNELAMKEFNAPYERLTKYQQAQIQQSALDRQAANSRAALRATNSGGGNEHAKSTWGSLRPLDQNRYMEMYGQGDDGVDRWLEKKYPNIFGSSGQPNAPEDIYSPENMTTDEKAYAISIQDLVKQEDLPLGELSEDEIIRFATKYQDQYKLEEVVNYVKHLNEQTRKENQKQLEERLNESELSDRNSYFKTGRNIEKHKDTLFDIGI